MSIPSSNYDPIDQFLPRRQDSRLSNMLQSCIPAKGEAEKAKKAAEKIQLAGWTRSQRCKLKWESAWERTSDDTRIIVATRGGRSGWTVQYVVLRGPRIIHAGTPVLDEALAACDA